MSTLSIDVFRVRWRISCPDPRALELIARNFSEFVSGVDADSAEICLRIEPEPASGGWRIDAASGAPLIAHDAYELIYLLEKLITIEVQRQRNELFFLHGATLEYRGTALLLVASSGSGKSTTAWALVNRGFGYLSDELAPVDLETLMVTPYPHALCLKANPPAPFGVPAESIVTSHTLHVPTALIRNVVREPRPLHAIFFNRFDRMAATPQVTAMTPGAASALLYTHALNPLAHDRDGLRGVAAIAAATRSFALTTADLELTCELVRTTMDGLLD